MSRCMSCDAVRSAPRQWRSRPTPRWGIASKVCLLRLTCRERVHPPTRSEGPFMTRSGIHPCSSGIKSSSHFGRPLVVLRRERLGSRAERSLVAD